jgi:putative FmdB family regulatory protein
VPTYEYKCKACDHRLEAFHSMSAKPLVDCPECEKPELQKLISAGAGMIFRGSGFYETDYKRKGEKKSASEEKSANKKTPASCEGCPKAKSA